MVTAREQSLMVVGCRRVMMRLGRRARAWLSHAGNDDKLAHGTGGAREHARCRLRGEAAHLANKTVSGLQASSETQGGGRSHKLDCRRRRRACLYVGYALARGASRLDSSLARHLLLSARSSSSVLLYCTASLLCWPGGCFFHSHPHTPHSSTTVPLTGGRRARAP